MLALAAFALPGCGGSNSDTNPPATDRSIIESPASSAETRDTSTGDLTPSETDGEAMARHATCTLAGKRSAEVSLRETDDALVLTFEGQPVPPVGDSLYAATVFDSSGEVGVQLGMSFLDGDQDGYFVFDFGSSKQANLTGDVAVSGTTVTGTFPVDDLGGLAGAGAASWSAAFNVRGNDVGTCPGGIDSLPFPG